MSNKNADHYFLRGGGEMGELIRAKDWSKTSLGDPADWPQSLQTMVAVMLDNPFGMYIAWGSQYIQLYNDGYRPILGATKHPQALGISTRETFSEIWDNIIGSMFDDVMKGKAVGYPDLMLPLNRNGFVEECYFDFSYSPIRKDNGEVGGVLVTVIETTDQKKAQAALIESTDQLKFAMDAAELGTWDYNPATDKFTANNRLKTWFGLSSSEEIELHHATDAIAEKDRDRIILAIKKALDYSSGGNYEEEFTIINPINNNIIIVQVKGRAWFNDEKIAYRFNGILQEVTENVLARKKIEENEEQLRIAIEGGEFGTFDFLPETNQLIWSAKTKELFGLPPNATVGYDTYIAALHPEDRDTSRAIAQQQAHLKEGGLYELEYRTIGITDGKFRWLRSKGKATYNKEGEPIRYTGVIQDITKQKESAEKIRESNQRFRNTMKQAPVGITILRGPEYIVEMANNAYLQLVDKKEAEFVGNPLFDTLPEVEETVHALLDSVLNTGIPYHGNEVAIPVNRHGKQDVFYFDFLYHPLKEEDGKISGVIVVVTEVTEKVEARKTIEERKRLYETITQNTPDLIYVFDLKCRFSYANEALLNMWGRTWYDSIGKSMLEVGYEGWHAEMHEREIDQVIATKKPVRGEVSFPHATLGKRIYDYILVPVIDDDGKVEAIAGTTRDITQQVEARNQIQESETRFRNMVEQAPVAICVLRGENYVVEIANEKQLQVWGKTKKEVMNKPVFTAIPEGAGQGFEQLLGNVFTTGKPYIASEIPLTVIRNGKEETSFLNFVYEPLYGNDHKIDGVLSVATEVTEQVIARKQIEESKESIQESKEQLEFILESAKGGYWDLDLLTNKAITSFRHDQCFGATEPIADWSYEKFLTHVHPEDREKEDGKFKAALATGTDWSIDCRVLWKDGSIHWIQSSGRNHRYIDGKPTRMLGMVREVTKQKEAQQKIEESEQRFQAAVKAVQGILWTNNAQGEMEGEQPGWALLTGQTYEEYRGYGWLQVVHPDDAKPTEDAWNDAVQERKTFIFEHRLKIKNGEWRDFSIRAIPLLNADGTLLQWVGVHTDITINKQAARALKANEEKLNIVIEASELGTWEIDVKTNIVEGSLRLHEIMGYPQKSELTLIDTLDRIHPDYVQLRAEAFRKAYETGIFYFTGQIIWDDNSIHWIESKGKVFYDEQNNPVTIIGTTADITEEKNHQQALQESEERFRTMADNISQLAWMTDEKGQMIWYNKRWLEYTGTTMEQMLNEGAKNIHHPEHRSRVMDKYLKAVEDGKEWEDTFPLLGTDGQYRWFLSRAITIKNADGKVKQWFGTNTDITELMEADEALKKSEEKFRLLADSMPQHIWTSDPQGNLNYYNQSVFDYSGLTLEQINKDGWIQIVHPDDREENIKQWVNAVSTGKDFLIEHRFRRHDGEYRWQLSRAIPQRDANGKIQMWVGTSTDIQEQKTFTKELELQVSERTNELEASNTELQKMNKELQSFAYISSHDLQEPLRKIQTFASRIKEKEENNLSDSGKDMFNRMQNAAERMQTLIQDLLAYSRTNTTERKFVTTDLNEIIAEVKEDLMEELKEKHATIEANQLCDADIIPFQFRQLMHNLIGNALKFSNPENPPHIQIKSEIANGLKFKNEKLSPQKMYCHISVTDNGIGFEQQYSEKIFEVFQRLHGKNEYNGTGIGLSIVKKIIENHHGIITAKGELNKGATFDIYIPAT